MVVQSMCRSCTAVAEWMLFAGAAGSGAGATNAGSDVGVGVIGVGVGVGVGAGDCASAEDQRWCRGAYAEVQRCRDAEVQRFSTVDCAGAECREVLQRYLRCRGAVVQVWVWRS